MVRTADLKLHSNFSKLKMADDVVGSGEKKKVGSTCYWILDYIIDILVYFDIITSIPSTAGMLRSLSRKHLASVNPCCMEYLVVL